MSTKLFFLLLTFPALAIAAPAKSGKTKQPVKSESALERLEKGCVKQAKAGAMADPEKICACVKRNMEKLTEKELNLLARTYEGDASAEKLLEKNENSALQNYDVEVAEKCLEDPSFKVTK